MVHKSFDPPAESDMLTDDLVLQLPISVRVGFVFTSPENEKSTCSSMSKDCDWREIVLNRFNGLVEKLTK